MWTLVRFAFHTLTVCDVFNLNLSCPPKESQFVTWALRLRAAFSRGLVLHRAANNLSVNGPPLLPGENDVAPRGESKGPADVGVVADEADGPVWGANPARPLEPQVRPRCGLGHQKGPRGVQSEP